VPAPARPRSRLPSLAPQRRSSRPGAPRPPPHRRERAHPPAALTPPANPRHGQRDDANCRHARRNARRAAPRPARTPQHDRSRPRPADRPTARAETSQRWPAARAEGKERKRAAFMTQEMGLSGALLRPSSPPLPSSSKQDIHAPPPDRPGSPGIWKVHPFAPGSRSPIPLVACRARSPPSCARSSAPTVTSCHLTTPACSLVAW